jgi:DNA-directed RNA polymerase subunit beta
MKSGISKLLKPMKPLDDDNHFVHKYVTGRFGEHIIEMEASAIDLMDVSPKQVFSVATAMIPFLENDDANRALMGSNMQRQAVPLLITDSSIVGTGMEHKAAVDSGVVIIAERDGVVDHVSSSKIVIKTEKGERDTYKVVKFTRSNQGTCINQRPLVFKGDKVEAGHVIADGPSTDNGEIALGKNPLIGFHDMGRLQL